MKRLLTTTLSALIACICVSAQVGEEFAPLLQKFQSQRTLLNYEYIISGPADITVQGTAVIQKNCFRMEGAGLLIMCDGDSVWTLDLEGKEAYVEKAGPMDYLQYIRELAYVDDHLEGTIVEPASGTIIPFALHDLQFLPVSGDLSPFSPSEEVFASGDWIITDLR